MVPGPGLLYCRSVERQSRMLLAVHLRAIGIPSSDLWLPTSAIAKLALLLKDSWRTFCFPHLITGWIKRTLPASHLSGSETRGRFSQSIYLRLLTWIMHLLQKCTRNRPPCIFHLSLGRDLALPCRKRKSNNSWGKAGEKFGFRRYGRDQGMEGSEHSASGVPNGATA
jgi:hypothetical protein